MGTSESMKGNLHLTEKFRAHQPPTQLGLRLDSPPGHRPSRPARSAFSGAAPFPAGAPEWVGNGTSTPGSHPASSVTSEWTENTPFSKLLLQSWHRLGVTQVTCHPRAILGEQRDTEGDGSALHDQTGGAP